MDKLTNEEKILAWNTSWEPSFVGVAIVNRDFTFRSVNPQFCKLLGVTQAELIGHRFQDITPIDLRELDEQNAKLVMDGQMDYYLLPKSYEFSGGRVVHVVLLVSRAPHSSEGAFEFFVSRIMLNDKLKSGQSYQTSMSEVADFLMKNIKIYVAVGSAIGAVALGAIEAFKKLFLFVAH